MRGNASSSSSAPDVMSILIATDNHLGYMERDPVRGDDSLNTFQEILSIAKKKNVDFILLGGDLFHDNKPSRKTVYETMALLREYCMGNRPCAIEYLSDQSVDFQDRFAAVNYQDPNYNVGMPVFSIHGNHDDPSGDGKYCALDILSVSGLVNYFGKQTDVDDISLSPLLLKKGETRISLYGLGNIRDERLNKTFRRNNVEILRPNDDGDWFNIMVLHQNRIAHGPGNHIPETYIDNCMDFVLWGHEHECRIDPETNTEHDFCVCQPGSSIATSLCEGESVKKHVGILNIKGTSYQLEKIPLKSVRPFVNGEVILAKCGVADDETIVKAKLTSIVNKMVHQAKQEWQQLNPTKPADSCPLPLIRLRVEYTGFTTINPHRFGQPFVNVVANPKDILLFYRKRQVKTKEEISRNAEATSINIPANLKKSDLQGRRVEDLIKEIIDAQELMILPENELNGAVFSFVEKHEKDAITDFLKESLEASQERLTELKVATDNADAITSAAATVKKELVYKYDHEPKKETKKKTKKTTTKKKQESEGDDFDEEEQEVKPKKKAPAKRTTTRKTPAKKKEEGSDEEVVKPKRASKATSKPASSSRATSVVMDDDENEDDIMDEVEEAEKPVVGRGKKRVLPFS